MQLLTACAREATLIMGVLNATPDSVYAASRAQYVSLAVAAAKDALACGADLVDVGGESSRPGAEPVSADEEIARVVPLIESLTEVGCRTSVDTYRAETARRALAAGATMVNDITGLRGDSEMEEAVAESGAECVIMHMLGNPRTMQRDPKYRDVVGDIRSFFEKQVNIDLSDSVELDKI